MLYGEGWHIDAQTFQVIVKENGTRLPMLNKKNIKVHVGWAESFPTGHVVSCKHLRGEGLHIFLGMVEHCMKDKREEHFEFDHHNVFVEDMNENGICKVWES